MFLNKIKNFVSFVASAGAVLLLCVAIVARCVIIAAWYGIVTTVGLPASGTAAVMSLLFRTALAKITGVATPIQ